MSPRLQCILLVSGLLGVLPVNTGRVWTLLVSFGHSARGTLHCCLPCVQQLLYATLYCHPVICTDLCAFGLLQFGALAKFQRPQSDRTLERRLK
jgi:hypothetical protein